MPSFGRDRSGIGFASYPAELAVSSRKALAQPRTVTSGFTAQAPFPGSTEAREAARDAVARGLIGGGPHQSIGNSSSPSGCRDRCRGGIGHSTGTDRSCSGTKIDTEPYLHSTDDFCN
jgi:hypothetical protein